MPLRASRLLRDRLAVALSYSFVICLTTSAWTNQVDCNVAHEPVGTGTYSIVANPLWSAQELPAAREEPLQPLNVKRSAAVESVGAALAAHSSVAAGFLLSDATDLRLNLSDPIDRNISQILDRDGPDMRPSRDYKDFKDISVDISKRAWWLLHKHVSVAIEQQVDLARPAIESLLRDARVSDNCTRSIGALLDGAKAMDSWALRLVNSWGHFPMSGIYEGTYGSVGSFHTCLDIEENKNIGHAHYCSVTFRPLMPSQKDYEIIVRQEPKELRQMFEKLRFDREMPGAAGSQSSSSSSNNNNNNNNNNSPKTARLDYQHSSTDAFTDILEHAQYHHFLHYKWGTCWPIQCSPFDVRRVAKTFGRRSILLNGPVKCYSRFPDDYEQPDWADIGADGTTGTATETSAGAGGNASLAAPSARGDAHRQLNATRAPQRARRKLVISVWDKNNGIFIWKPHFTRTQKVALAIIVAVSSFIALMTAIDICFVRLPPLCRKLLLCLRAMPLDFYDRQARGEILARAHNRDNGRCQAHAHHKELEHAPRHPTRVGFALVSPEESHAGEVPASADAAMAVAAAVSAAAAGDEERELAAREPRLHSAPGLFMSVVDDCSVITNLGSFFRVSEGQMRNDILCLNGVRCITMIWIIMTHSMMYNDWTAFARTRAIEVSLDSLISQPVFNGSYLVDTFFLMSGLLSAFTAFKHCQGKRAKFNSFAFIFGRWLRLTPQILFVSMIFIVFPALSRGPHWFPIVGEFSENCSRNWWINVLHLQAFYKQEEMCNFVTWWISIDFFYHFFALALIWLLLTLGHKLGALSLGALVSGAVLWQSWRHYTLGLPPNVFSTIPQTGAMWTTMTLDFFWTPYTHSVPFFFGFYLGYLMALKRKLLVRALNTRRALAGWLLSVGLFVGQSYSTYWWVTGRADYSQPVSTLFFAACSFVWAGSLCWLIVACQHGYGGFVNRLLSARVFIVIGKSSYLIYLSHFMVLFVFFGRQNVFLEPSPLNMLYIVLGNILMSTLLGIGLCAVYEIPWLKMHRRLMKYV